MGRMKRVVGREVRGLGGSRREGDQGVEAGSNEGGKVSVAKEGEANGISAAIFRGLVEATVLKALAAFSLRQAFEQEDPSELLTTQTFPFGSHILLPLLVNGIPIKDFLISICQDHQF
ncbi:hypothetical protein M0804_000799 [Polistes exclamans]|nr:hypothetical protein M0804_000799 [Polistes exclamans]